jgi:hypothetical protein
VYILLTSTDLTITITVNMAMNRLGHLSARLEPFRNGYHRN